MGAQLGIGCAVAQTLQPPASADRRGFVEKALAARRTP